MVKMTESQNNLDFRASVNTEDATIINLNMIGKSLKVLKFESAEKMLPHRPANLIFRHPKAPPWSPQTPTAPLGCPN